ncbi:MAG: hypothetical protein NVS3B14_12560 [Ktedonobacteraceae bacterium]
MSQQRLPERSPLNTTLSPHLLKPLRAGEPVAIIKKYYMGSFAYLVVNHPLAAGYQPEFHVQWVVQTILGSLALLQLYVWIDPDDLADLKRLDPDDLLSLMGIQFDEGLIFPQTLIKVDNPNTLKVLSDQEFVHALPYLHADIASRRNFASAEWNAELRQDIKAVFAL